MKALFPVVLAALALGAAVGRAEIEFSGYLRGSEGERFVLTEAERVSDWLDVGASFRGHTVTAYDAKSETLTLTREGATVRVRLKGARTAEEIEHAADDLHYRRRLELFKEVKASMERHAAIRRELLALDIRYEEARTAKPRDAAAFAALAKAAGELRARRERANQTVNYQWALVRMLQDGQDEKHPFFVETQEKIAALRKLEEQAKP